MNASLFQPMWTGTRRFVRASRKPPRAPLFYRAKCVPPEFLLMLQRHRVLKRRVRDEEELEEGQIQYLFVPTKMSQRFQLTTATGETAMIITAEATYVEPNIEEPVEEPVEELVEEPVEEPVEGRSVFDERPLKPLDEFSELVPAEALVWLPSGGPPILNGELQGRIKHWKQFKADANLDIIRLADLTEFDETEFTTILDLKKVSRRQKKLANKIATEMFAEKPKKKSD